MTERWELLELIGQAALRVQDANLLKETVEAILDSIEPIICTDALSRFSITEFPNGKIRTLIADGTHWVPVSTANSMVDAAKARTVERMDRYNAQVEAERQSMDDLRDKVEALGLAWSDSGGYRWVRQADVLALFKEKS